VLVNQIVRSEPLISDHRKSQLRKLVYKLIEKSDTAEMTQNFYLFKILRAHILPLTNCAFNKSGDRFITGSYDRTCKVWNTLTGEELLTLEGHKNVVYAIAFNNPFGDKVVTGSFDKTAKIWNSATGELLQTLRGHTTEIVCLSFDPQVSGTAGLDGIDAAACATGDGIVVCVPGSMGFSCAGANRCDWFDGFDREVVGRGARPGVVHTDGSYGRDCVAQLQH